MGSRLDWIETQSWRMRPSAIAEYGVGIKYKKSMLVQNFTNSIILIGEKELKMMKAGSYLVNPSRGGLVDKNALYRALASGQLRGAALDTFEREPYEGPLRELDNAILTPHIGSYPRVGPAQ